MKKIVTINASPRATWNTATLVKEAARGAEHEGAEIKHFDLYKLDKFTGCISCFGCKLKATEGICVCNDGLKQVLDEIRTADGLIIGSPNYLGDLTAGFRALYERLVFPYITYNTDKFNCNDRRIPVALIVTSNASEDYYEESDYGRMIANYKDNLENFIGPTEVMIYGDTLQVSDYSKYNWTYFDPAAKKARHEAVFGSKKEDAFALGRELVK